MMHEERREGPREADERRFDDRLIGQLIQEVKDLKEQNLSWQRQHDSGSREWRQSIDARFVPIEEFIHSANISWKLLLGMTALVTAILKAGSIVREHWR